MSWLQTLSDLGVQMGLFGAYHARDLRPELESVDPHVANALAQIGKYTCGNLAVLCTAHEPGRVWEPREPGYLVTGMDFACNVHLADVPACGVLVSAKYTHLFGVHTVCMPLCDHAAIGLQIVDEDGRVLALGAFRATPDRLCGNGSVIAAIFEHTLREESYRARGVQHRFHLSAGRGPCCMKFNASYAEQMVAAFKQYSNIDFEPHALFDKGQIDMLAVLVHEIRLRAQGLHVCAEVHARDRDCTVCCAAESGIPYYNGDDVADDGGVRHNLWFFSSEPSVPRGTLWNEPA